MRALALLALAGCSTTDRHDADQQPPPAWVYAPGPVALVGGAPIGRIGRSQAPQRPHVLGITGRAAPLHQPTPWNVPGAKARALVYGTLGRESAIELVDIDAGSVLWRDTAACQAGVVGVTEDVIVCADANGVRGVGIDGAGKARWRIPAAYLAMTDDRVVVEGAGEAVIIDASSGDELSRVKLPTGVLGQDVRASCGDAGRELFVQGQDGKLARVADSKGGAAITWAVAIDDIDELDACSGAAILVRGRAGMLVSIDRTTGRVTGRIEGVRGSWRARDGSERIEVATQTGVASWSRDLVGEPVHLEAVVLGELLAERGGQRLVRATAQTAVLLDAAGVRAYLPFGAMGAALGDSAILASSWTGSAGHVVRRLGVPPRYRKRLRLSPPRAAVAVPAELRDLPAMERVETDGAITVANAATRAVLAAEVDPDDPARLYVLASESMEGASVIAIDLVNRAVHWQRANACGGGAPIGLQPARGHVICATSSSVHGLARDGATRWTFPATNVDRIAAAGDVVLVFDADTLTVLDIETGAPRWRSASDDGGAVRADAIAIGAATYVVTAERGLVVARMTSGLPLWSIGVDGTVANVRRAADGALIELEDGDAYRLALPSGEVTALPGVGLRWGAVGDVVIGEATGGPIPGPPLPPAPKPLRVLRPTLKKPPVVLDPAGPRMWKPLPVPPARGTSLQITLFDLAGGLRARNDYAVLSAGARSSGAGPAGSMIIAGPGTEREVLLIEPMRGDPRRRVQLPDEGVLGPTFSTIVDGRPIAGTVLHAPLRVVIF